MFCWRETCWPVAVAAGAAEVEVGEWVAEEVVDSAAVAGWRVLRRESPGPLR